MVKHKKSPVTLDFDTAVASVPDTNSIKNLVGEAIDLQIYLARRTTKQEQKILNNWEKFELEIKDIDRLYHIVRKDDDYGTYFELMVRIKKNGIGNSSNEYLYSYLYAEYDNRFFENINGFIFVTKNIELLLAIIVQERPRKIYTCQVIYPCHDEKVFNTVAIHNNSNKFHYLLTEKDSRKIWEFSRDLPVLENVQQILKLLKKDGIDVDPAFIDKKLLKKKSTNFQRKIENEKDSYYLSRYGSTWVMEKDHCKDEALLRTLNDKPFVKDKDDNCKKNVVSGSVTVPGNITCVFINPLLHTVYV